MKIIGLFLIFLSLYGMEQAYVSPTGLLWLAVGLALLFFDVIIYFLKTEIRKK
ncbi:hypothetical protein [Polynucleobacter sp. IMCC 29146]|uniref:hypothetical protein n=1 Tax=Polynucleobacter sp. IMCC 29146 TaxID=2780953 RepID=UPI001F2902BD|nr:hypothetical protein [Polynucleobacter sp. IMCC 29146]MCE7530728.1 hypothetical protein [Polynucleobacter sp. IMCC 29146]